MDDPVPIELRLLKSFHLLLSSTRIYQDNNKVLVSAVERFVALVHQLCHESDEVTLLLSDGSFYLNRERVVFDRLSSGFAPQILQFFEERGMEGLRFHESIRDASLNDIVALFRWLDDAARQDDPVSWLERKIGEHNLAWVEHVRVSVVTLTREQPVGQGAATDSPAPPDPEKGGEDTGTGTTGAAAGAEQGPGDGGEDGARRVSRRRNAIQTYGYAVLSLQDITQRISSDRRSGIRKIVRLAQNMVDMVVSDNTMFLSLSTIRDYDDYTYTHSINVAILSICIGNKIGLSRRSLESLSLGALFHDLGKTNVPRAILNKPGRLSAHELQVMKEHSLDSVRRIIKLKTSRQKKVGMLLPPFEHHLKYDLSGYPQSPRKKPLSLFGRIVCIADVFDALTAPRVYRPEAWSPDRALGFMLELAGKDFDPVLLKVFINMIGIYPIGTLLRLDNDDLGLVARYSEENDGGKELWLQLIHDDDGGIYRKGDLINLGPWSPHVSSFNRPVLESLHPSVYGIQPAEFLL